MCGIAGIVDLGASPGSGSDRVARLRRMLPVMAERGPDAEHVWESEGVALGHRRLRIIDLSSGADQPMVSHSEALSVVFNGEIYNHRSLRAQLIRLGHTFRTRSDTEVLLHGYQAWGEGLVERLSGMFAFAIWDDRQKTLLLARDRVGKKPLYYSRRGDTLLFASDIKAILAALDATPSVDLEALACYLTLFSVPEEHCIFQGIERLPAAHTAMATRSRGRGDPAGWRVSRYWEPRFEPSIGWSDPDVVDRVEFALRDGVARRLQSDVPLAVFLSGGIDSGLVTALAAEMVGPGLSTITVRFGESSHDEGPFAAQVARQYNTDHHELMLEPATLDILPELVWQFGEPFSDSSALAQYQIATAVKPLATVVLTGDGGDELFGGYRRYAIAGPAVWLRDRLNRAAGRGPAGALLEAMTFAARSAAGSTRGLSDPIRGALGSLDSGNPPYFLFHTWYLDRDRLLSASVRRSLGAHTPDHAQHVGAGIAVAGGPAAGESRRGGSGDPLDALMRSDLHYWLPADMLRKVDVSTMAASVEARSPLLDYHVLELAALLDPWAKVHPRHLKHVLRRLAARLLPQDVVNKPKWGFVVPVDDWVRGPFGDTLEGAILGDRARDRGLFDYPFVAQTLAEHRAGRVNHKHRLWSLLCLELWFQMFVDGTLERGSPIGEWTG